MLSAYEIDNLVANDRLTEWERLNEPDPCEKQLHSAAKDVELAADLIYQAITQLQYAEEDLVDTPMQKVLEEKECRIQDVYDELIYLQERYEKGERE